MIKADVFWACWVAVFGTGAAFGLGYSSRAARDKRHATIDAPTNGTARYCRDCRFCFAPRNGPFGIKRDYSMARCLHPTSVRNQGNLLAAGQYDPDNAQYCSLVRDRSSEEMCGPEGRHWEAAS